MSDDAKRCPHCEKKLPQERISDEAIEQMVKMAVAAEYAVVGTNLRVSDGVRMLIRMARTMNEDEKIGDLVRSFGKERIQ